MKCCRSTILTVWLPKQEGRNFVDADWRVTSIIAMRSGMTRDKLAQKQPKPGRSPRSITGCPQGPRSLPSAKPNHAARNSIDVRAKSFRCLEPNKKKSLPNPRQHEIRPRTKDFPCDAALSRRKAR